MKKHLNSLAAVAATLLFVAFFYHSVSKPSLLPANCPDSGLIIFPKDSRNINGISLLGEVIGHAKTGIDLVMYTLINPMLVDKLIEAHKRGVNVRIIKEMQVFQYANKKVPSIDKDPLLNKLKAAGIRIHSLPQRFLQTYNKAQAHHKVLIVDQQFAIVMSANWDEGTVYVTRDFGLILTEEKHPNELKEIQAVFEADWNNQPIELKNPDLVWGPDHQIQKIQALIKQAQEGITIYQQGFSDPDMTNLLCEVAKKGIKVKLLMMPFPFGGEKDTNNPFQEQLMQAGGEVRFNLNYYMHPKVVIIDNRKAYIGSCNFYPPSLKYNRELGVITEDSKVMKSLLETFNTDWKEASPYKESKLIKKDWSKAFPKSTL